MSKEIKSESSKRKKKSSIIKLAIVGVLLVVGIILSVVSFELPGFNTYKSFAGSIKLGLDLKGGVSAVYEADSSGVENFSSALEGTRSRLEDLIVSKGFSEATVTIEGTNRLRVEVPDIDNPSEVLEIIGEPAGIEFVINAGEDNEIIVVNGDHISGTNVYYSSAHSSYVISLDFTTEGANRLREYTTEYTGSTMAIYRVIDGVRESSPISSPTIEDAITTGSAVITMTGSTYDQCQELADQITAGTFDLTLSLKDMSTISPTLGEQALSTGIMAGVIGLLLVVAFLIWRYRLFGVVATIALAIYGVLMLFFLAVLPWVQLTLPGIAGIILSLGMAVDGNVVIYERIKDEYKAGSSLLSATYAGFKKALTAILDSNITTVIASVVLIIFGTGSISGFGLTLLIGILLSMFSSVLVTRFLCNCFTHIWSDNAALYGLKRAASYVGVDDGDAVEEGASEVLTDEHVETEFDGASALGEDKTMTEDISAASPDGDAGTESDAPIAAEDSEGGQE